MGDGHGGGLPQRVADAQLTVLLQPGFAFLAILILILLIILRRGWAWKRNSSPSPNQSVTMKNMRTNLELSKTMKNQPGTIKNDEINLEP